MPIGAETFVSAALQPLFERLFSLGEFVLAKLTSGGELAKTLRKWKRELRVIEVVLVDAEYQQYHSRAVKTWLEELQDLAYDMEDVLDHFATQLLAPPDEDAQGVLGINSMVTSITNNLSTLFNLAIDPDIQEKIDDITERLDEIKSQTHDLRHSATHIMQQSMLQSKAPRDKRESSSLGSEVFGRDDKKQDIITQLLEGDHGDKNYVVIPIVGMGGIGKTTLAQYVYNDEQVKGHFELMAWVCVSNVFDVKRITTTIYKAAFCRGTPVDFSTLDEAQTQLKQVLMSRKFLIVLDDIWNEKYEPWDQLKKPLRHAPRGSRVIMTTRNKDIARMMNTDPSHNNIINLEGLSDKECWCVFQQHASSDSDLAELRDDVIKKWKGLPLAAKVLGSLLKKTVDKRHRRMILESDLWTNEENDVLPVLRLSYCLLPSHLKRIFAYCCLLPKDYRFADVEVILLWMAQGFLPDNQPQSMEDLGQNYFDDLVSRSLFEQHPYHEGTFTMHDLVHDLALWAAGNICHVTGNIDKTQVVQNRTRHVFYTEGAATTLGSQFPIVSQLRTFYCDFEKEWSIENLSVIKDFRHIRTLCLCSEIDVLPQRIGELQHLRFLHLKFKSIKELPTSIGSLWNLQTLLLEGCSSLEKIPNIGGLKRLRYFLLKSICIKELPTSIGSLWNLQTLLLDCFSLEKVPNISGLKHLRYFFLQSSCIKELPTSIGNLWNLQILSLGGCSCLEKVPNIRSVEKLRSLSIGRTSLEEMPMGFEKLTNLQELDKFILGLGHGARVRDLKDVNHLEGELKVCGLENVLMVEDAREAQLYKKCKLDKLCLKWGTGRDGVDDKTKREVLEQLKPHTSIKECKLKGYRGSAFPTWLGDPCFNNMVRIHLINCKKCECLPPLGQLPRLELLWIEGNDGIAQVGPEFFGNLRCSNPFPSLKTLRFEAMQSWEKWLPSPTCELAHLRTITIESCPSLISFPEGLLLPALERLSIVKCANMESLPREMHKYTSLQCLEVLKSPKIQCFPVGGLPKTLEVLRLDELNSLPSSLSDFIIEDFPNLKSIRCSTLPNLGFLRIKRCPKLQSFVDNAIPPHLKAVVFDECDLIKPALKRDPHGRFWMDGARYSPC